MKKKSAPKSLKKRKIYNRTLIWEKQKILIFCLLVVLSCFLTYFFVNVFKHKILLTRITAGQYFSGTEWKLNSIRVDEENKDFFEPIVIKFISDSEFLGTNCQIKYAIKISYLPSKKVQFKEFQYLGGGGGLSNPCENKYWYLLESQNTIIERTKDTLLLMFDDGSEMSFIKI